MKLSSDNQFLVEMVKPGEIQPGDTILPYDATRPDETFHVSRVSVEPLRWKFYDYTCSYRSYPSTTYDDGLMVVRVVTPAIHYAEIALARTELERIADE